MTEKLYYRDAYESEFCATVLSCEANENRYDVVLDKTAFFPNEGGQYADSGTLDGVQVLNVAENNGVIHHYTAYPLEVGKCVHGAIDFYERYEKMQSHSGEHILSGIIHARYGLDNVGFHLGRDDVTMDISAPLTREELDSVERIANEIIYKNIEITAAFPSAEELASMTYRSKLDLSENVRIVKIGEYDSCACCAPHVKRTGEIGVIKILDFTKLRGGIRIHIAAGRRAFKIFQDYHAGISKISALLSVPKCETPTAVEKLSSEFCRVKNQYGQYRISTLENMARKVEPTDKNLVLKFEDLTVNEMISFSNIAIENVGGVLVLLSGTDGNYKYVISSKNLKLREFVKEINKSLLGRGGGKDNMVQGSFESRYCDILKYFNP